jgi:osmotically-inducible protein OsmY
MWASRSLKTRVQEELEREPGLENCRIRVREEDGVITLHGHVDGYAASELADRAVFRVEGVVGLIDQLSLRPVEEPRA